jgi:hypothetical protein
MTCEGCAEPDFMAMQTPKAVHCDGQNPYDEAHREEIVTSLFISGCVR